MVRAYKVRGAAKMKPPHPGAILREDVLPALGVSVTTAVAELGIPRQTLHTILAEKAPVTAEMAIRLGRWCGNGPELWNALQRDWDLWRASERMADVVRRIPVRRVAA
ncbi:MAG: HigA family addiction module antitoxin [Acetobacteraceae bacterium]